MTTATLTNHQVRLAKRPEATATREHWNFTTEPVAEPAEGGVLIKTLALSLDPAMRGWLNDAKSYIAPVEVGAVMRAGGIGRVVGFEESGVRGRRHRLLHARRAGVRAGAAGRNQAQRPRRRSTCGSARRTSGSTCSACPA